MPYRLATPQCSIYVSYYSDSAKIIKRFWRISQNFFAMRVISPKEKRQTKRNTVLFPKKVFRSRKHDLARLRSVLSIFIAEARIGRIFRSAFGMKIGYREGKLRRGFIWGTVRNRRGGVFTSFRISNHVVRALPIMSSPHFQYVIPALVEGFIPHYQGRDSSTTLGMTLLERGWRHQNAGEWLLLIPSPARGERILQAFVRLLRFSHSATLRSE